jgi:orotidine-5'-phosphate decarboxylase
MNFADKLISAIESRKNPTCLGLDPRHDEKNQIPKYIVDEKIGAFQNPLEATAEAYSWFCREIVAATHDIVPIYKPNAAFFERCGHYGMRALQDVVKHIHEKNSLVIVDGKRNDIGSTAEAYSDAFLGKTQAITGKSLSAINADAITTNPYLGSNGISPFSKDCKEHGKGIFTLVRTSNPSAKEFQSLSIGINSGYYLHTAVARKVAEWGSDLVGERGYSSVGAVIGATHPREAKELRKEMPQQIILVPGFGAQGGNVEDVLCNFNEDGKGAIINNSRGLNFAYQNEKYSDMVGDDGYGFESATREATIEMRDKLSAAFTNF